MRDFAHNVRKKTGEVFDLEKNLDAEKGEFTVEKQELHRKGYDGERLRFYLDRLKGGPLEMMARRLNIQQLF